MDSKLTVGILGMGYVGCTLAAYIADRGHTVIGIEADPVRLGLLKSGQAPMRETGLDEMLSRAIKSGDVRFEHDAAVVQTCDVVLIAVGTPLGEDGGADLSDVTSCAESLVPHLRDGQAVVLKSTLPPGSTSDILAPILRRSANVHVAFSPERLAEGQALNDIQTIPIIVGGVDDESTEAVAKVFKSIFAVEIVPAQNSTAAELTKLADNLWIDLNIALANELAKVSDSLGVDALDVIRCANSLPKGQGNVNILIPSIGVGGYCLTKDPLFLHSFARSKGLDIKTPIASRTVNDSMPDYTVDRMLKHFSEQGLKPDQATIGVLGVAFKTNTSDCRFSPTIPTIKRLIAEGFKVRLYDPWVNTSVIQDLFGIDPQPTLEDTMRDADCIAFFTGHDEFKQIPLETIAEMSAPGSLVFDGRMFFPRASIVRMRELGMIYKGIGR